MNNSQSNSVCAEVPFEHLMYKLTYISKRNCPEHPSGHQSDDKHCRECGVSISETFTDIHFRCHEVFEDLMNVCFHEDEFEEQLSKFEWKGIRFIYLKESDVVEVEAPSEKQLTDFLVQAT